ncbi:MAG: ATP-dependent RNA helicase HrpA [Actinomycetota bacterium]|nr:ATP-dependent RNA helicase HrpA [Actinomycetota bacterium]
MAGPLTITYPDLPVVEHREALLAALREHQVLVVAGETGSGKSTQLPKLCLEAGLGEHGWVGHTQPRRIAARAVAERVAEELGSEVGGVVGSKVRFNDQVGEHTRVKVMTDGVLLAEIAQDRRLRRYEAIIVDEAHERSLNIDFLLGYLRQLLPERPDLKVIITSATIDTARFSEHFADAPVIEVSGRSYPVEVRYRPIGEDDDDDRDQTQAVCDAVDELGRERPGDVLVFLSGEREIRDTADALNARSLPDTEILPLYARLSASEQHRVFSSHRGRRIVLATNVAETSLTVPGIVGVIDTGTARISRYSRRSKVQRLPIEPISQASADQRAGRCGRVAPGTCIRLYAEDDYDARPRFTEPEILRTNLASVILQLAALGLGDVEAFPFVDPPDSRAIKDGLLLLEELGAIRPRNDGGEVRLTKVGRRLARLPVDPRLGRMVLEADRHGCVAEVLVVAAALSIQDPRERPSGKEQRAAELHARFAVPDSDFLTYLNLWRYLRGKQKELGSSRFRRMCRDEHLHFLRIREWQDLHAQLRQTALGLGITVKSLAEEPDADGVHRAVLSGMLSHIGRWDEEKREYRGARETRFTIAGGSALGKRRPKWVVAAELVETDRLRARTIAAVTPERIEAAAGHLVTRSYGEPWWERERATAMVEERVSLYGLPIVPRRKVNVDRVAPDVARELFLRHALVRGEWDTTHPFIQHNRDAVVEVAALEHRLRRDLLVPEDDLVSFFDERVPDDVTNGRRFDSWWRKERGRQPDRLDYTRAVLTGEDDPGATVDEAFPEWVRVAGVDLPLTYTEEPGSDLDGVTVDVPLLLLDRAHEAGLDWQVPGRRVDLLEAIVRSLPKEIRRDLGPVPEVVAALSERVGPTDGSLLHVLPAALGRLAGRPVAFDAADLRQVPEHLRVVYRAVDGRGRPIAWSRDLAALRSRMRARLQAALAERSPIPELTGLRDWPDDGVPRTVAVQHAGTTVTAYPALGDEGDSVARRVLASQAEQAAAMWSGTRRLLLLALGSPLRSLDRSLPTAVKLDLARTERFSAAEVYRAVAEAAVDHLLLQHGGPPWDRAGYEALAAAVRADFVAVAVRAGTQVSEAAAVVNAIDDRLSTMVSAALDETVVDVQAHVDRLLGRAWITTAGVEGLPDVVRYLRGIEHRLTKAVAEPGRDASRLRPVRELEAAYRHVAHLDAQGDIRRQLEELRVATFAQAIGASGGVSEQKVRRALAVLGG